jgi:4-amino-4-deoxy-L-arabinose transferase-like glycosyltransferase
MQPRIAHQPTDRNKALWKRVALFALIAIWLFSGIVGRDPWKPDEPIYIGVLHSMLVEGGNAWWSPSIGGASLAGETPFIHWVNAAIAYVPLKFLPLHEAARFSSVFWAAIAALCLALSARRWSAGHISYLAAIVFLGCVGLYDRAHTYVPDIALVAAISIALYGVAELAANQARATCMLALASLVAFMSRGALGALLVMVPVFLLNFAPVLSMYRVSLIRSLIFAGVLIAILAFAFSQRAPTAFYEWVNDGAGLVIDDRDAFSPAAYFVALLWFAWPIWPIAVWTLVLRVRGFAGGWQRAEIVAPIVFFVTSYVILLLGTEQRTAHAMFFLPALSLLAAFGVDTIRRTWYAMIDWFGILVLGIATVCLFVISLAAYLKWPPNLALWLERFIPGFRGDLPWFGYVVALIAFLIWIALIQPAHQHSRRALINWTGCVTFLWVVAQALLLRPADYVTSYRSVVVAVDKVWPAQACVNSMELSANEIASLDYYAARQTQAISSIEEMNCEHLFLARWKGEPAAPASDDFDLLISAARPGNSSERFELYRRKTAKIDTTNNNQSVGETTGAENKKSP